VSQAFTTHHPNAFTSILSLSEGRVGIAWIPSNKMLFLLPSDIKRLSLLPQMFSHYFYSSTIIPDSLSLSLSLFGFGFKELSENFQYVGGKLSFPFIH
jgi:hypothetical protein